MRSRLWKIVTVSLLAAVAIGCAVLFLPMSQDTGANSQGSNMLSLVKPPFISAAENSTNFLEEEAGMSAYTNVGQGIDLDDAKTGFRTIEYQTSEYIIGSVALPGYTETEDVHCYVHKDGWVVAYYLEAEPAAKIVDWNSYQGAAITSTKLENGMAVVCDAANVPFIEAEYYDFRYPNADNLMIAADALFQDTEKDTFTLKIPSNMTVYERSWLHYAYFIYTGVHSTRSVMKIDGNVISDLGGSEEAIWNCGRLTVSQLGVDLSHTISVESIDNSHFVEKAFDAIVLVYQEG